MAEERKSTLFDSCLIAFVISRSLSPQSILQVREIFREGGFVLHLQPKRLLFSMFTRSVIYRHSFVYDTNEKSCRAI